MSISDWLTIAAIIIGPIAAVGITLWHDWRNEVRGRKIDVLSSLMQTRLTRLSAEHVGALNLVQLEFYGQEPVMTAHRQYIEHLNAPIPPTEPEQQRFFGTADSLFHDLLAAIADTLNYNFDKQDLARHSYVPQGWQDYEGLQHGNMVLLSQLLKGERALQVTSDSQQFGTFPPTPTPTPTPSTPHH